MSFFQEGVIASIPLSSIVLRYVRELVNSYSCNSEMPFSAFFIFIWHLLIKESMWAWLLWYDEKK
jgi:hypothetical protein